MSKIYVPQVFNKTAPFLKGINLSCVNTGAFPEFRRTDIAGLGNYLYPGIVETFSEENYFARVRALNNLGLKTWITLFGAPPEWKDAPCAPIRPEHVPDYAAWCRNIMDYFWENKLQLMSVQIWNEPDLEVGFPQHYGCWGITHFDRYLSLLGLLKANPLPYKISASLSSVFSVSEEQLKALSLFVDAIHFHGYESVRFDREPPWTSGWLEYNLQKCRDTMGDIPIHLTETSLLHDGYLTPSQLLTLDEIKVKHFERVFELAVKYKLASVVAFADGNIWLNCNTSGVRHLFWTK